MSPCGISSDPLTTHFKAICPLHVETWAGLSILVLVRGSQEGIGACFSRKMQDLV